MKIIAVIEIIAGIAAFWGGLTGDLVSRRSDSSWPVIAVGLVLVMYGIKHWYAKPADAHHDVDDEELDDGDIAALCAMLETSDQEPPSSGNGPALPRV